MSIMCLRDGLFALNIERLPFIKMNKYFLTYREGKVTGDSTKQFVCEE